VYIYVSETLSHLQQIPFLWHGIVFILGAIIGSFLNVYIYRFHTGKSISGHSHCLSCQTRLRFYDLFPLLSYLSIGGRCRYCHARVPVRYFLVELMMGIGFVAVVAMLPPALWVFGAVVVSILMVVAVYDLRHMIIPNEFVVALSVIALGLVAYRGLFPFNLSIIIDAVGGALLGFLFFGGLWWYSKGRWIGFGDAKLAIPFGLMVGAVSMFSVIVLSFWIGTVIALSIIVMQKLQRRGQRHLRFMGEPLTIQSEVPFAPFFILGFIAVFLGEVDVLQLFTYVWL
jgi:leader peptidase (prepilin peptidase) / N-methyltransferase